MSSVSSKRFRHSVNTKVILCYPLVAELRLYFFFVFDFISLTLSKVSVICLKSIAYTVFLFCLSMSLPFVKVNFRLYYIKSEWYHFSRKNHFCRLKVLVHRIFNIYHIKALTTFFILLPLFFLQKTDFLGFKRGSNIFRGWGGVQLFQGGGEGGFNWFCPIETHMTCAFRRVGGPILCSSWN